MPNLTVHFQGLCLFCRDAGAEQGPVTVYLPWARTVGKEMIDGCSSHHSHDAWLLVQRPGTPGGVGDFTAYELDRADVQIGNPAEVVSGLRELSKLPDFSDFASDVDVDPAKADPTHGSLCARVALQGGTLRGRMPPAGKAPSKWFIDGRLKSGGGAAAVYAQLYHSMEWLGAGDAIVLNGESIPLEGGALRIIVGNRPDAYESWPDDNVWNKDTGARCDHHFRWYYDLLRSTQAKDLRTRVNGSAPRPCDVDPKQEGCEGEHLGPHGAANTTFATDAYPTCFCASC